MAVRALSASFSFHSARTRSRNANGICRPKSSPATAKKAANPKNFPADVTVLVYGGTSGQICGSYNCQAELYQHSCSARQDRELRSRMLTVSAIDCVVECMFITSESELVVVRRDLLQALDGHCRKIAAVSRVICQYSSTSCYKTVNERHNCQVSCFKAKTAFNARTEINKPNSPLDLLLARCNRLAGTQQNYWCVANRRFKCARCLLQLLPACPAGT